MNTPDSPLSPELHAPQTSPSTLLLSPETPTLAWLIVLNGPHRGKLYRIKPRGLTIGRAEDNDIVLEDETVSRYHARLLVDMGIGRPHVYIQDLASVNGVFVNDERVVRRLLEDEDRLVIGGARFAFKHL